MNRALLVLSFVERCNLSASLDRIGLEIVAAKTCAAARREIMDGVFEVIVAQHTLADGGWCNVLGELLDRGLKPVLVVGASMPDGWSWSIPVQRGGEYTLVPCHGSLDDVIESELRKVQEHTDAAAWVATRNVDHGDAAS